MKRSQNTIDQLKKYTALSAAFLAGAPLLTEAAPVIHDIPDITLTGISFLNIDMVSGATVLNSIGGDFTLHNVDYGSNNQWALLYGYATGNAINYSSLTFPVISFSNNFGQNFAFGDSISGFSNGNAGSSWAGINVVFSGYTWNVPAWDAPNNKGYLGVHFFEAGQSHYGWIEVSINGIGTAGFSTTLHAFGYDDVPNATAIAGGSILPTISLVDANGDGIPDITDPCSCADPLNIYGGGAVTFFHDFIEITSGPGETWEIATYVPGQELYDFLGNQLPIGTVIPEVSPGVYYLDVYHADAVGFDATFDRTAGGGAFTLTESNSCVGASCASVPTLSTWGLISMCLFLMSFGSIVLIRRAEYSFADQNTNFSMSSIFQNPPIDWSILSKTVLATLALAAIAGAGTLAVYGTIAMVDVLGTMVAGPLFAYLAHLMLIQWKKK